MTLPEPGRTATFIFPLGVGALAVDPKVSSEKSATTIYRSKGSHLSEIVIGAAIGIVVLAFLCVTWIVLLLSVRHLVNAW
jgi:hypothetical protein